MSDLPAPSLWEVMAVDPSIPIDPAILRLVIGDQRSASRRFLYPWLRLVSRAAVMVIVAGKRLVPVRLSAHDLMDALCLWFLRRFVSPVAVSLLIRHFIVETNLLNFCARNAGLGAAAEVSLRPATLAELGHGAVIEHDLNVYRVLYALGQAAPVPPPDPASLDFSMLTVPETDPEPQARRFLRLDIQTALCVMNVPFALCLTPAEYQRAVHSLRLDTSVLSVLSALTGDGVFRCWRAGPPVRVSTSADVPVLVYEHAVLCEYALGRLAQIGESARHSRAPGPVRAAVAGPWHVA
jgi:hypothetical protein